MLSRSLQGELRGIRGLVPSNFLEDLSDPPETTHQDSSQEDSYVSQFKCPFTDFSMLCFVTFLSSCVIDLSDQNEARLHGELAPLTTQWSFSVYVLCSCMIFSS